MKAESGQERSKPEKGKPAKKVAFVLSGGANRGALEVGVLQVLLEHDIRPQILVGTSVGAINAAFLATNPTLEGARWLELMWRQASEKVVERRDYVAALLRFMTERAASTIATS